MTEHFARGAICDSSLKMISVPVTLVFAQNAILGGEEKKGSRGIGWYTRARCPAKMPVRIAPRLGVGFGYRALSEEAEYESFDRARIGSVRFFGARVLVVVNEFCPCSAYFSSEIIGCGFW